MFELLDGEKGGGFYSDSFLEFMYPMTLGLMICFSTTLGYRGLMRLHIRVAAIKFQSFKVINVGVELT